jgi:hypothetical protein
VARNRDACLRLVARNRDACLRLVARNRDACLRLVARNRDACLRLVARNGNRVAVLVNKCSARAHCLSENRTRRASARHSAVKTAEGACERSEVLTARQCRALQSHAVFRRNAPQGRPISPVRANWLQTRELSRAQRESERVWRVKV